MIDLYPYLRPLLMAMDPETAHRLTLCALKTGLVHPYKISNNALKVKLWGREFQNPLGLAAGFDKNAEVIAPSFEMGFGFVEAGTVTPLPQSGNSRPRVFRDAVNESIINRMGFPGKGVENFAKNVSEFRKNHPHFSGILGVNIGINKGTDSPINDYRLCMEKLSPFVDYITLNISSPNTAGLRDLQTKENLEYLLAELVRIKTVPVLLKIASDLNAAQREDIAGIVLKHSVDGLVISNTTVTRPAVLSPSLKNEKGGLSGKLLKEASTEAIRDFYRMTEGSVPIIGVGGISSAEDAYEKIRAGASLVQVYTALVYQGPALIARILEGLPELLKRDGFSCVADAVGSQTGTGKTKMKAVV